MKKLVLAVLILTISAGFSFSQNKGKFAHIDVTELLTAMPQKDSAQKAVQDYAKQLEDQLVEMQKEYEKKYNDYNTTGANLSDLLKKTKEDEINQMIQRINTFQQTAQQDLQNKESELMKPILDKVTKAIKAVGEENGFLYVFEKQGLLYISNESVDIMPLVKKKLGIK
jgi:outer membrane protein